MCVIGLRFNAIGWRVSSKGMELGVGVPNPHSRSFYTTILHPELLPSLSRIFFPNTASQAKILAQHASRVGVVQFWPLSELD